MFNSQYAIAEEQSHNFTYIKLTQIAYNKGRRQA